jgi:hypothetical protein
VANVDTFVIRIWSPADATGREDSAPTRGVASHVATGRAAPFRNGDELLALLRDLPAEGDQAGVAGAPRLQDPAGIHR